MSKAVDVCMPVVKSYSGLWLGITAAVVIFVALIVFLFIVICIRRFTKWRLECCGLPVILWRPKFISYEPFEDAEKLSSSTITRILPRMKRLRGPFGMYGTVYGIKTPVVHIAHPTPARAVLGNNKTIYNDKKKRRRASKSYSTGASKAPAYDHFKNFCGDGVFTADGDDWKAKRASVMHCLVKGANVTSSDISKRLELESNAAADRFIEAVLKKEESVPMKPRNVVPMLQRATIGLIYRYITHHEPDWLIGSFSECEVAKQGFEKSSISSAKSLLNSDVLEVNARHEIGNNSSRLLRRYLESIVRIRMIILAQSRSVWFVLPRWCYKTLSSLYRDEETTLDPIRQFAERACRFARPGSPLANLRTMPTYYSKGGNFSKNLLDEAITLLFAGQDTTAATLSWTLHLLSIYPGVQRKLADEVCSILDGPDLPIQNKTVTRTHVSRMSYLDAVIKESMRLYPVAPFVVRRLIQDLDVIEEKATEPQRLLLPSGSVACIWIYSLHRNPQFWNRPNDFIPERWLDPALKDVGCTNGAYMPFAGGLRNCIGQPLAHIILRTLLSKIIHRIEFTDDRVRACKDPKALHKDMQAGFTVLPRGGVSLSSRERKRVED